MQHLSLWASKNIWTSRALIAILINLINAIAIFWGLIFALEGFNLPYELIYILGAVLAFCGMAYPFRKNYNGNSSEYLNKRIPLDFLIYTTCALFFFTFANNSLQQNNRNTGIQEAKASFIVYNLDKKHKTPQTKKGFRKQNRLQKKVNKILKKIAKKLDQKKPFHEMHGFAQVLLFIGTLLLLLILAYVTAAISCSLSCSGNDSLAVIALIGGISITITVGILIFRWMFKDWKNRNNSKNTNTEKKARWQP